MEEVRKIKIKFDNKRTMTTYLGPENRIGDSYWVAFFYHFKNYFCLLSKEGKPLTPLLQQTLVSYSCTKDKNHIILELKKPKEKDSNFYHFKKKNNEYHCVFSTDTKNDIHYRLEPSIDEKFYYLTTSTNKKALYSLEDEQQLTAFFDELEIIQEVDHLAYFSKNIMITNADGEEMIATKLVGFIGYHGEFSSRILDTNDMKYSNPENQYYIILESGLEAIKKFYDLCNRMTTAYTNFYLELDRQNEERISELFLEKVEANDIPSHKNPAKIIEFPKR